MDIHFNNYFEVILRTIRAINLRHIAVQLTNQGHWALFADG